tara:strand:- start:2879 stop:3733 length:855 start_codon:yes stop_codon:yes gene_type:complete
LTRVNKHVILYEYLGDNLSTIVLFDMDGTLTPPREEFDIELLPSLRELSKVADIGILTGSDYNYVLQQLRLLMENSEIRYNLHILPCNGTKYYPPPKTATHKHELAIEKNMREELGDFNFTRIMHYILRKQSQLHLYDLPMTGHFVDYRGSMINWCPIGRNATSQDRERFVQFDIKGNSLFREEEVLSFKRFLDKTGLDTCVDIKLGGETSYDIYPKGWDKTYGLNHFQGSTCWFVGDRCGPTGNDREIYDKLRVDGRAFCVNTTKDTIKVINEKIIPGIKNAQ